MPVSIVERFRKQNKDGNSFVYIFAEETDSHDYLLNTRFDWRKVHNIRLEGKHQRNENEIEIQYQIFSRVSCRLPEIKHP